VTAIRIDWEELGFALTWRMDEGRHFLDRETGEVIAWTADDPEQSEEDLDARLAQGRLIAIEPLPSSVTYPWMEEFVETVAAAGLRRRLEDALAGRGPFRRFKDVLGGDPAERARWFAFHDERVRGAAREWLQENGVEVVEPSAPGSGSGR
jgi:hypothetical protein